MEIICNLLQGYLNFIVKRVSIVQHHFYKKHDTTKGTMVSQIMQAKIEYFYTWNVYLEYHA